MNTMLKIVCCFLFLGSSVSLWPLAVRSQLSPQNIAIKGFKSVFTYDFWTKPTKGLTNQDVADVRKKVQTLRTNYQDVRKKKGLEKIIWQGDRSSLGFWELLPDKRESGMEHVTDTSFLLTLIAPIAMERRDYFSALSVLGSVFDDYVKGPGQDLGQALDFSVWKNHVESFVRQKNKDVYDEIAAYRREIEALKVNSKVEIDGLVKGQTHDELIAIRSKLENLLRLIDSSIDFFPDHAAYSNTWPEDKYLEKNKEFIRKYSDLSSQLGTAIHKPQNDLVRSVQEAWKDVAPDKGKTVDDLLHLDLALGDPKDDSENLKLVREWLSSIDGALKKVLGKSKPQFYEVFHPWMMLQLRHVGGRYGTQELLFLKSVNYEDLFQGYLDVEKFLTQELDGGLPGILKNRLEEHVSEVELQNFADRMHTFFGESWQQMSGSIASLVHFSQGNFAQWLDQRRGHEHYDLLFGRKLYSNDMGKRAFFLQLQSRMRHFEYVLNPPGSTDSQFKKFTAAFEKVFHSDTGDYSNRLKEFVALANIIKRVLEPDVDDLQSTTSTVLTKGSQSSSRAGSLKRGDSRASHHTHFTDASYETSATGDLELGAYAKGITRSVLQKDILLNKSHTMSADLLWLSPFDAPVDDIEYSLDDYKVFYFIPNYSYFRAFFTRENSPFLSFTANDDQLAHQLTNTRLIASDVRDVVNTLGRTFSRNGFLGELQESRLGTVQALKRFLQKDVYKNNESADKNAADSLIVDTFLRDRNPQNRTLHYALVFSEPSLQAVAKSVFPVNLFRQTVLGKMQKIAQGNFNELSSVTPQSLLNYLLEAATLEFNDIDDNMAQSFFADATSLLRLLGQSLQDKTYDQEKLKDLFKTAFKTILTKEYVAIRGMARSLVKALEPQDPQASSSLFPSTEATPQTLGTVPSEDSRLAMLYELSPSFQQNQTLADIPVQESAQPLPTLAKNAGGVVYLNLTFMRFLETLQRDDTVKQQALSVLIQVEKLQVYLQETPLASENAESFEVLTHQMAWANSTNDQLLALQSVLGAYYQTITDNFEYSDAINALLEFLQLHINHRAQLEQELTLPTTTELTLKTTGIPEIDDFTDKALLTSA